jgi:hypothetical protein
MNWQDTCILHAGQPADHAEQAAAQFCECFNYLIYIEFIFVESLARALQRCSHRVICLFDQPARKETQNDGYQQRSDLGTQ